MSGDTFGLQDNDVHSIPKNVSTVVDLLETKGISWAEYEEDIPSSDFQGATSGDYARKHNPLASFESVSKNSTRVKQIKKLSDFKNDVSSGDVPQWVFVTPNMKNDGHDTTIAYAGKWVRKWLEPLLKDDKLMNRTLVMVTYDETGSYTDINRVYTVLLGGAVDKSKRGTTDSMYYNHYSVLSSISTNWGLPSLGRWDCDANVFSPVAEKAHYKNTNITSYKGLFWNESYPGPLNKKEPRHWWPRPATELKCASGHGVLPSVVDIWGKSQGTYNYTSVYPYDDSFEGTKGGVSAVGVNDASESPVPPLPTDTGDDESAGVQSFQVTHNALFTSVAFLLYAMYLSMF